MKKFLKTYFSNDGAGVFALLWVMAIIAAITTIISNGGGKDF